MTPDAQAALVAKLESSLADLRLSDGERREFALALKQPDPPEEGFRHLRNRAFEMARASLVHATPQEALAWLEGVMRALDVARPDARLPQAHACFSPGEDCLKTLVGHFRGTRRTVDLCVFTLSDDRITREVVAALERGVALRFITDNTKEFDAGSDVARLRAAGVPIVVDRTDAHMHHKFAIFDGQWLINGSYNWTRSACYHNEENLVATDDARLVHQFQQVFDRLWQGLQA